MLRHGRNPNFDQLIFPSIVISWVVLSHVVTSLNMENSFCQCGQFPLGDKKPLVAIWNAPTGGCSVNFSVHIDLKQFDIVPNPQQQWNGKTITVFSHAQLGLYPYYVDDLGKSNYNGGLPQKIDLKAHLRKASNDIVRKIPDPDFSGLAMIDWEGWRPLWDRNFDSKIAYRTKSIEMLRDLHPDGPMDALIAEAKKDFEKAARRMMEATIRLGKELRPKGLWGFYGFPNCYGKQEQGYQCSAETRRMNDELEWLFASSTALYPSIYMYEPRPENRALARGRLAETFRIALKLRQKTEKYIPVFPYFRHIYEGRPLEYHFLSDEDLRNTIGQAAEMGSSGVVMWGNRRDENTSPEVCLKLNGYIKTKLGPYFESVRHASEVCSTRKCNGRGRCISKQTLGKNKEFSYSSLENNCPGPMRTFTETNPSKVSHEKHILGLDKSLNLNSSTNISRTSLTASVRNHAFEVINDKERNEIEGITVFHPDPIGESVTEMSEQSGESVTETVESKKGVTSPGVHYVDKNTNSAPNVSFTMSVEDNQRTTNQMMYCNRTAAGASKCVVIKPGHHVNTASKLGLGRRIPKTYIYIFCGSAVGALVISALYIVAYYYFRVRKKSECDENTSDESNVENIYPRYQTLPICLHSKTKTHEFEYINASPNSPTNTTPAEKLTSGSSIEKSRIEPASSGSVDVSGVSPLNEESKLGVLPTSPTKDLNDSIETRGHKDGNDETPPKNRIDDDLK